MVCGVGRKTAGTVLCVYAVVEIEKNGTTERK